MGSKVGRQGKYPPESVSDMGLMQSTRRYMEQLDLDVYMFIAIYLTVMIDDVHRPLPVLCPILSF